jgi:hypothetical protein
MSKHHGWTTILYVNGGEVLIDTVALAKLADPLGFVRGEAEKVPVAA